MAGMDREATLNLFRKAALRAMLDAGEGDDILTKANLDKGAIKARCELIGGAMGIDPWDVLTLVDLGFAIAKLLEERDGP